MGLGLLSGCDFWEALNQQAHQINHYQHKALLLAKKNREQAAEITRLEYQIQTLEAKNQFLSIQLEKKEAEGAPARALASAAVVFDPQNDLVKQGVYQWSPTQLLSIGAQEFQQKNYLKAAQYYQTYLLLEPEHQTISDEILFQAGMAAYESGRYFDEAIESLSRLVELYPTSAYYRAAKLWSSLAYFKKGDVKRFYATVDEFRKKYKNTTEWAILREYYEEITQKYKETL